MNDILMFVAGFIVGALTFRLWMNKKLRKLNTAVENLSAAIQSNEIELKGEKHG